MRGGFLNGRRFLSCNRNKRGWNGKKHFLSLCDSALSDWDKKEDDARHRTEVRSQNPHCNLIIAITSELLSFWTPFVYWSRSCQMGERKTSLTDGQIERVWGYFAGGTTHAASETYV